MIITGENFSGLIDASNATEFKGCNFTQKIPREIDGLKVGVAIFTDDVARTFINCNLCNCEPPAGSILVGCNTTIKEFDTVVDINQIEIDGEIMDILIYEDVVYGKYIDGGYEY